MKVCKFSKASISSVDGMKNVAQLVNKEVPQIVVFSAATETTTHLETIAGHLFNREMDKAHDEITKLEFKLIDFANELLNDYSIKREALNYILDHLRTLRNFANNSFASSDERKAIAQGELISTALMSLYLKEKKYPNALLNSLDFMRTGVDKEPDIEYISEHLHEEMNRHRGISLFITQGGICKNAYNETDYFKHGNSDYSASLIGAAVEAEEIQIWTDFNSMYNSDPRIVKNTSPIKKLSFEEAERLAYFGAKTVHPLCIAPAREKNIPVRLLNTTQPEAEGTLISKFPDDCHIKAVAAKDAVFCLKFETNHTLLPYLFISKVFEAFAKYRTPPSLLTSSHTAVTVATDNNKSLSKIIRELSRYATIIVEDHMSIVSVIGNMKWQFTGIEAKIVGTLKNIPLRMISYGSNNNDVSFVVKASDKQRTLQLLNDTLFTPELS